jgi:NAD(P)-dependent dehydrogenase (short-subunit alcohol dehydrogenase family)
MSFSPFDLTERIAIITGGATGIGRAIADGLAAAGANIAICGRRINLCEKACEEIQQRTGVSAVARQCDVSRKKEIEAVVKDVVGRWGHIDILVNNAGVTSTYNVLELPEEEWDRIVNINLKGCFLFGQAAGQVMARKGGGVIINIGSQLGEVARPNRTHYVASKGGVRMLTKAMAVDLAPHGIRVNTVAPGPVETELTKPLLSDQNLKDEILKHLPIGRIGQPSDIAGAVVFLASDAASFVTGVTLYVDGGYLTI